MHLIEFHSGARRDFDESLDWYAAKSVVAAVRFVASVEAALAIVAESPLRFGTSDSACRECPLKRFPFRIVYRVVDDRVLIMAIAHTRRRPSFWRDRMSPSPQ